MNISYKVSLLSLVLIVLCCASQPAEDGYVKGSEWKVVLSKREKQQRLNQRKKEEARQQQRDEERALRHAELAEYYEASVH